MQPTDLASWKTLGRPSAAPDGALFVALRQPDLSRNTYLSRIVRIRPGGEPVPFTQGDKDSSPLVTPDGRTLVFVREADGGKPQLYAMPVDGGEARRLTDHPLGVDAPVLSPLGDRVAYLARVPESGRYGTDPDVDPDAEAPRRITSPAYRLDGVGFLLDRPRQLFAVDLTGGAAEQLTAEPADVSEPAFTAAGDEVLYVRDQPGTRVWSEIVAVPAHGGPTVPDQARPVVQPGGIAEQPVVVGDRVHFVAVPFAGVDMGGRTAGLWWVPVEGGRPVRMTDAETVDVDTAAGPVVAIGGLLVAAVRDRGAVTLVAVPPDARALPLTELVALSPPHTEVRSFTESGERVAAVVADPSTPGELQLFDPAGGPGEVLTDVAGDLRATGLVAPQELSAHAPDGTPVHGWLFLPPGDGPHPVLLSIHGGPHAAYGWGLFDEAQVYASAGYAVVMGNPRGSAGYGEDHGRVLIGRFGDVDVADVLALLDAAVDRPDCDADRVGVMGGSYGGFLTTWLAGHTGHRFRAAISERALNVWDSFGGSSDIGHFFAETYVGPDRDRQWSLSPLAAADAIEIPVLIIHSEQDWRCPLEQAQRLFVALHRRGVAVEMLVFPGEGHELSRSGRPAHRVQRFDAILDWWARQLGPMAG